MRSHKRSIPGSWKTNKMRLLAAFSMLILLSSCGVRKAQGTKTNGAIPKPAANFSLNDSIATHRFVFHTLSAKIKSDFKNSEGREIGLIITMRAVHDSAIWMSISPGLGIEAARVLLTRDSVKILDKINQQYAVESYDYMRKFTEADVNFEVLQNIFTGNMPYTGDSLITDSVNNYYYAHSSRERTLQELTVNNVFRVLTSVITEKTTFDKLSVSYSTLTATEGGWFPLDARIDALSGTKSASLQMNYSNLVLNMPVEMRFVIPSGYTKIKNR
jgi:hypothetical protein